MELYAILRRHGWHTQDELQEAAARSTRVSDEEMSADVRWIRTYVLNEASGALGTICIYEATSPDALRRHAELAHLPIDEIIPVGDTLVIHPDPQEAAA